MELDWTGAPGAEGEASGGKRRRGRDGEVLAAFVSGADQAPTGKEMSELRQIVAILSKPSLRSAFQLRVLRAVCLRVVLTGASFPPIVAMKAATKTYQDKTGDMDRAEREQKYGLVHAHAWNGLLTWFRTTAVEQEDRTAIEEYLTHCRAEGGIRYMQHQVRVCRVAKAFNKGDCKLELGFKVPDSNHEKIFDRMVALMRTSHRARLLAGQAPPGQLEDLVQQYLDKNLPEKKDT